MKIALCDDSSIDRRMLKEALFRFEKEHNIEFSITEYSSSEELYNDNKSLNDMSLIFLDIYMDGILGTDAAKKMREMGYNGSIIFCTSSEDHALEGFRVHADGYLVKPFTYGDFKDSMSRIEYLVREEQKRVEFVSDRIEYSVLFSDITMIETSNKGCIVHMKNDQLFTWTKLKDFVDDIDSEGFYQIGRYYLVNIEEINSINEEYIVMKDGTSIKLPRRDAMKIRQDVKNYISNKMKIK